MDAETRGLQDGEDVMTERFTERARKVLEMSLREALALGHNYVGTEHILLALLRDEESLAYKVLDVIGGDGGVKTIRDEVIHQLMGRPQPETQLSLPDLLRKAADALETK